MNWVADILLIGFLGLFIYRGIKRGFLTSSLSWLWQILGIVLGIGSAVAVCYFVFDIFGWLDDLKNAFYDFGQTLSSFFGLFGLDLSASDFAYYLAIGIPSIIMIIPMSALWRAIGRQLERFIKWVRSKWVFGRIIGSILGGLVNIAFYGALVLGFYWLFAAVDGSGLFTYTNEVLRSGYLTGLIYEYNPLYKLIGGVGCFAEDVAAIITGSFLYQ